MAAIRNTSMQTYSIKGYKNVEKKCWLDVLNQIISKCRLWWITKDNTALQERQYLHRKLGENVSVCTSLGKLN